MHARARSARMDRESACRERDSDTRTHARTYTHKEIREQEGERETARVRGRELRLAFGGGFRADGRPVSPEG